MSQAQQQQTYKYVYNNNISRQIFRFGHRVQHQDDRRRVCNSSTRTILWPKIYNI